MSNLFFSSFLQVSVLETGEVCMELLKSQSGQERVKEVLRISSDGLMVRMHLSSSSSFNLMYWAIQSVSLSL